MDGASGVGDDVNGSPTPDTPERYLFTVDGDRPREILPLVCDLVADAGAELFIGAPLTVPTKTPIDSDMLLSSGERLAARYALRAKTDCDGISDIHEIVRTGHHRDAMIQEMVENFDIATLIEEHIPKSGPRALIDGEFEEAVVRDICDTIVVSRIAHLDSVESILVPVAAGPHSGMAIDVGLALARQNDATVELLHVVDPAAGSGGSNGETILATGMERAGDYENLTGTRVESADVSQTITDYTADFDITVMGTPREGHLEQFVRGTIPEKVGKAADGTVLTTHRGGVDSSWLDRWLR